MAARVRFIGALCMVVAACGGSGEATDGSIVDSTISDEQRAAAAAIGDIEAGEQLFDEEVEGAPDSVSCSSCHSLDGVDTPHAPTLKGMSARAGDRIDGLSAADYLRQSILDPYAYSVEGDWSFPMPYQYPDLLSEEQVDDLVAFLLTQ